MKKIIALLLAVLTITALLSACAKSEPDHKIDAILDYYTNRMSKNITKEDIKYIGEVVEDDKTKKTEYLVENEEEGVSESLLVEEAANMCQIYKKGSDSKGMYIHRYIVRPETTEEKKK
ncbi:MAG: hypothetical protein IKL24_01470 [Clostridia bacterium]|nr:hypothetical protein [Clostridia bacterium]